MRRWTRWAGLPRWVQLALAVYAIGFLEGAGSHVQQIVSAGVHAYDAVWWPSQALYYTLVVWDSLAVYLALRAHRAVVPLGVAIMAADLPANWHYNWAAVVAHPVHVLYLTPMSLFGLFVAGAGVPLWRVLRRRESWRATPDIC
ncbi:hypothetical protein KGQ20_33380 [Catenulispora sp. NF23]|uniref:Integral membrane protein n=1 Tax=Catenulispora pinistramenti TaxID=2705254 RepID=A0ABS5L140_9ACTN|nr:hypothetical protein [Catenulispora pinistramenti]MBS2537655.1 hypothetical protein [Catenulispora pinistramenti]MBS2552016.1 hypothetical protein [Catenulispora pinistramenti]